MTICFSILTNTDCHYYMIIALNCDEQYLLTNLPTFVQVEATFIFTDIVFCKAWQKFDQKQTAPIMDM